MHGQADPCFDGFLRELDGLKLGRNQAQELVSSPMRFPYRSRVGYVSATLDTIMDSPGGLDSPGGHFMSPSDVAVYLRDVAIVPVVGSLSYLREVAVAIWSVFNREFPESDGLSFEELLERGDVVEKAPGALYQITISRGDRKNAYHLALDISKGGISTVGGRIPGLPFLLTDNLQGTVDALARQTAPYVILSR